MWSREQIKTRAKEVLRFTYWKSFLVSLIILLAGGSENSINFNNTNRNSQSYINYGNSFPGEILYIYNRIFVFLASITLILMIFRVILGYILEVGGKKYFLKASEKDVNLSYLGFCFSDGRYWKVIGAMFLRAVYTILWTLLFIIPGIVKSYAYRMVPYILADNPGIGSDRAIQLSNEMTNGEKLDMFVLDLSFLGWYLLGALLFGVGILFVNPYKDATMAELYLELRENAINKGYTTYNELNIEKEYVI
jgi:uncharacterized membrane protein